MKSSELTESEGCEQSKEDDYERTSEEIKECSPKQLAPNNACESPLRSSSSRSQGYTYDDGRDDETVAH
jgi:hypothetical protein